VILLLPFRRKNFAEDPYSGNYWMFQIFCEGHGRKSPEGGIWITRKRYTSEQIIQKLRETEVFIAGDMTRAEALGS